MYEIYRRSDENDEAGVTEHMPVSFLYGAQCKVNPSMKTNIQIHKEGKYYVAVDLVTNVADQGLTEAEAVSNLKKGLEEQYQILMELATKRQNTRTFDNVICFTER